MSGVDQTGPNQHLRIQQLNFFSTDTNLRTLSTKHVLKSWLLYFTSLRLPFHISRYAVDVFYFSNSKMIPLEKLVSYKACLSLLEDPLLLLMVQFCPGELLGDFGFETAF